MNIFDYYHVSLLKGLKDFEKKGAIKIPEKTNSISVEVPPEKFDADISTNVCMVLSGINKSKPKNTAITQSIYAPNIGKPFLKPINKAAIGSKE